MLRAAGGSHLGAGWGWEGEPRNAGGELGAGICLACWHPDGERFEISASHRPAAAGFIALNAAVLVPVAEHRV